MGLSGNPYTEASLPKTSSFRFTFWKFPESWTSYIEDIGLSGECEPNMAGWLCPVSHGRLKYGMLHCKPLVNSSYSTGNVTANHLDNAKTWMWQAILWMNKKRKMPISFTKMMAKFINSDKLLSVILNDSRLNQSTHRNHKQKFFHFHYVFLLSMSTI